MNKRNYVKRQKQTRRHNCHWPGCTKQVPPAMWGCKYHWFRLPIKYRRLIWKHYRPGQENDMNFSEEYYKVVKEVQMWIRIYGNQ